MATSLALIFLCSNMLVWSVFLALQPTLLKQANAQEYLNSGFQSLVAENMTSALTNSFF